MSRYSSSNPFATITTNSLYSDSDTDSLSQFVTDLYQNRSSTDPPCPWDDEDDEIEDDTCINPFSNIADFHQGEPELGLGFDVEYEYENQNQYNDDNYDDVFDFPSLVGGDGDGGDSGGLRVVEFCTDSESSGNDEEFDYGGENDDERVSGLCWDSLCLEDDHRSGLNDWEEVIEGRVNENEEGSSSLLIDEVEVDVDVEVEIDEQSMESGFEGEGDEAGEEALRYLEWEILLAFNNLERNGGLEHEDESLNNLYLAVHDGIISGNTDYDILFGQLLENDGGLKGSPPAAKSFVENLPLVELTEEELKEKNVVCAVCKDEVTVEEKVGKLPCSHCYHGDCILPWLNIRNTCPVCRYELPTDDDDYEQSKVRRVARDLLDFAA
jgi:E3 ubiquitin-protein ligase RNF115/126